MQSDGKILIGGWFTSYAGTPRNGIARLNGNGGIDTSFDPGSGMNAGIWHIDLQPDGKALIAGWFTSYNGTPRNRIARVHGGEIDCHGDRDGTAFIDNCGTCVGGNTGQTACTQDCDNEWGGTAFMDNCGTCVGGSTGQTPCVQDCDNEWGGTAFIDGCGDCVGGNTGLSPCSQTCTTDLFLVYEVDGNIAQVAWSIHDASDHSVVRSGGVPTPGNGSVPTCLPNGCFYVVQP